MLREVGCAKCERLWNEYETATRDAFALESKVQLAGLAQDSAAVLRLQPEMHRTVERRRALRKQILMHGVEAHGQAGAAEA
jgi:hypothetical protein